MAMTLARAVHERALAEEVAAKAALTAREAVEAEPEEEPPAPSDISPAQGTPSKPARSGEQTRRAPPRARVRVASSAAEPAPVMDAGALFARLSDIVRQCLELEIRIEEELRRLEAALFVTREPGATLGGQIEDAGQEDAPKEVPQQDPALQAAARARVCAMVEAVIEAQVNTRRQAQPLYTALRERLDGDEAYRDLASRPDAVSAASLCRDLSLHPNPRWSHPPPDP
jgi:hypothetical protein